MTRIQIYCDGASSGNPGPSGIGVTVVIPGKPPLDISTPIGHGTNNRAEYHAVLVAVQLAFSEGWDDVIIITDSKLVIGHLTLGWKNNVTANQIACSQVKEFAEKIPSVEFMHIPREHNGRADRLSKEAVAAQRQVDLEESGLTPPPIS